MATAAEEQRGAGPAAAGPAGRGRRRIVTSWDLAVLLAANAAAVAGLWWRQGGIREVHDLAGLLTSLGRLTGLLGTLLALAALLLLARVPGLDDLPLDRVNRWHRWNGVTCLALLVAHTVLIAAGYALADGVSLADEARRLLSDYSGVALATVGLVVLVAVAATSGARLRRRLGRRAWRAIHVTAYAGIALAFSHELATGHEFQRQPVARAYWWGLYGATVAAIVLVRVVRPLWRSLAVHRLYVERVVVDAPGVVSVVVAGRRIERLGARAGQYLHWRFLAPGHRLRARTLSLSAAPVGSRLRVTAAERPGVPSLRTLRPGTRAIAEGPIGGLTRAARRRPGVALVGGGPGIAPLRALLEDLTGDVVVVCRASGPDDVPLGDELDTLARRRGAVVHYVAAPLTADVLLALVPDIAARDVFVCGPSRLTDAVGRSLRGAGVPERQIASEGFG